MYTTIRLVLGWTGVMRQRAVFLSFLSLLVRECNVNGSARMPCRLPSSSWTGSSEFLPFHPLFRAASVPHAPVEAPAESANPHGWIFWGLGRVDLDSYERASFLRKCILRGRWTSLKERAWERPRLLLNVIVYYYPFICSRTRSDGEKEKT